MGKKLTGTSICHRIKKISKQEPLIQNKTFVPTLFCNRILTTTGFYYQKLTPPHLGFLQTDNVWVFMLQECTAALCK
jgi:hypothetical protein